MGEFFLLATQVVKYEVKDIKTAYSLSLNIE